MTPELQRMDWMPSPPLAPIDSPLDLDHLARMTLGDAELEQEVLAMFAEQAARLIAAMAATAGRGRRTRPQAQGLGARDRRLCGGRCRGRLETAVRTGQGRPTPSPLERGGDRGSRRHRGDPEAGPEREPRRSVLF